MARGMYRSRTLRRVQVRVPGGKTILRYDQRKPSQGRCAQTGEVLHGAPRAVPKKMQALAKTKKRPSRPFGGFLGSKAMRMVLKYEAREEQPSQE
jgi:large subunit ribosomal protein L34e